MQFNDRVHAGRLLAARLKKYSQNPEIIVLALPRGGVPVAFEIAQALQKPLDVFVVRKLGVPGNTELAMGAIASGGIRIINDRIVEELGIPDTVIDRVAAVERDELERREMAYRGHASPLHLRGKTVILVDDGMATGSTMRAAVAAIRQEKPERIVVAVPTASATAVSELEGSVDELMVILIPEDFAAVGRWYRDFSEVDDGTVTFLLREANRSVSAGKMHLA